MTQRSFFDDFARADLDPCASRHGGNPHSEAAHESIADQKPNMRAKVLAYIAAQPDGATCEDVERALEMKHQTASARLTELKRLGLVEVAGERRQGKGTAAVYRATGLTPETRKGHDEAER